MKYVLIAALALMFSAPVMANGNPNSEPCSHPVFMTHDCNITGAPGADGKDGVDGRDGIDGVNGINGIDGVIPNGWFDQLDKLGRYSLALDAAHAYLPMYKNSRFTLSAAQGYHQLGVGIGYAYVDQDDDNKLAFTIAIGGSRDVSAAKVSIGFEF